MVWKVWSLVVCSQSYFHVGGARKVNKKVKKRLSFAKELNLLPKTLFFNNVPFQSTKYRTKELCVNKQITRDFLEICIVQHVEMKIVFTFQPINNSSFYDCENCEACCHVLKNPFRTNFFLWRWWYTLFSKKDELRLRKRKVMSVFVEISPPVTIKHTCTWVTQAKIIPFMA